MPLIGWNWRCSCDDPRGLWLTVPNIQYFYISMPTLHILAYGNLTGASRESFRMDKDELMEKTRQRDNTFQNRDVDCDCSRVGYLPSRMVSYSPSSLHFLP